MMSSPERKLNDESQLVVRGPYVWAVALFIAAGVALLVDLPVARLALPAEEAKQATGFAIPGELRKLLSLSEIFGHGLGVALVILCWFVLDNGRRWSLPRVLACTYGSGLAADFCKLLVGRTRPNGFDLSLGVTESFVGILPALKGNAAGLFDRAVQSFPSGHSATAAGLAVILSSFYPRARWLFVFLAALALLQRVEARDHFLSDTLAGAGLGCLVAGICLDRRFFGRFFEALEDR